jgi:hypothetical protein
MNDFTKEELEELLLEYELHQHNTRHNWPSLDLCKKLRLMIDNYCEHHKVTVIGENGSHSQCIRCGIGMKNDNQ